MRKCGLRMQFQMQDFMNWSKREDKALLALFNLLGNQIQNLDPMQKGQIRNKSIPKYIILTERVGFFTTSYQSTKWELMCKLYTVGKIIKLVSNALYRRGFGVLSNELWPIYYSLFRLWNSNNSFVYSTSFICFISSLSMC